MSIERPIHPDFLYHLKYKDQNVIDLYKGLRSYILSLCPESTELLYHTHALTSLYTVTEKMGDAFCMIPIYTQHLNLAFSKGTLLSDTAGLLKGTGKWMRHIPIKTVSDYANPEVEGLLYEAIALAKEDAKPHELSTGQTISKIKK
ncbi:DUF5655 domain-containing protein [Spongiimicrobium salis]|uniref:DUF5655 domain-containing protein n=1 Tax=Spongiimicrobium salis TaxID=1667022 RepID=UPI00374DB60D